ncbi:uncharacterized protein LOC135841768 isoform X2 [Planococcus citri]|uniref:uncharacterized protein LOC135841768 isoform X2 n=1 Tax=Planococcus citri TaxID=170843 RepID=UPI0031F93906
MFVLFFFAYSLAATCCSLANANTGPRKEKVAFPEPRNINEVEVQMKKCLEEKYNDPTEHLIAEDLHAKWSFMAAQAQTALNSELENVLRETKTLKVKLSLRTEVSKLFEYLSPIWLRQLTLKERYKWRLLLQLETESTELLKRIITQQMNLTVDQFSEDMEELMQISARGTYSDYLPHLECEEELDEILRSLEFTKDSLRKSLIAVIYRFQNEKHTVAFGSGSKYCFVHFPSLKQETTAEDIVDENVLRETKTLKVKLSLRTEVSKLFEYLSPIWLRQLTLKERYKWRLLLQLETESTELLKRIITQQMNLTVDQFSEDMEELMQISARGTYSDHLPHLECEEELDEILRSLKFTKDSLRKSLIAVIYRFQNEKHTDVCAYSKYCFLHFPSLKRETSAQDIVDFLNIYIPNTVHIDDVTIFEEETDEEGSSLNNVQAFIRLNKTIQNDRKEEINKLKNLEPMCDEIKEMTQSFTPQIPTRTIEVPPKKTQLVYKFCNSKPLILA